VFSTTTAKPTLAPGDCASRPPSIVANVKLFRNRVKNEEGSGLFGSSEGVGFFVVTPLQLADRPERILVNRGWVPKSKLNPAARQEGQPAGLVDLVGVVRKTEKREPLAPKGRDGPKSTTTSFRDIPALAERLGTEEVFLDADAASTTKGGPLGGQTILTLRNDHLSYLLTW